MNLSCKDCLFFLAVDAFKGICKRDKARITQESEPCSHFEKAPRCKFCRHYQSQTEFTGLCTGIKAAWPDLPAANCDDFQWIGKN